MAYKNLVLKGGGVLGIAYVGAYKVLYDNNMMSTIERIAGTSAGAILATLICVGYTPDELYKIMHELDFKTFQDNKNFFDIFSSRHGLYRGKVLQTWIEKLIAAKLKAPFATFRDLHTLGLPDLSVVTTYLNERAAIVCNYNSTPDAIVSEAVRASMSIPFFFDRFIFTKGFNKGQNFVDGGVMLNYPISLYIGYPEEETVGLFMHDVNNMQPPLSIDGQGIMRFIKAIFEAIMAGGNAEFFNNSIFVRQTVVIDSFGISATNFALSDIDKMKLYQSGIDCTKKFLKLP